ncbi:nitroreductase family protein [Eubacteriales bacterium OttesenSCG-928-N13]|nr:nitroreductase family protein [Eubacteriales bacterium OttesenSCG-928-N13]
MNAVQQAILDRRSNRGYEPAPLTPEQVQTLVDAALASPSAVNGQPWHFSVVSDQALLGRIHEAAKAEWSKTPEQMSPRYQDPAFQVFYHAPLVIFISADMDKNQLCDLDCGIAVQNIAIAAQGMGLGSVILGLPRPAFTSPEADEIRAALQFPTGYDFRICIAVGKPTMGKPAHEMDASKVSYI